MPKANYLPAVGRRKRAIARVRLVRKAGDTLVNDQPIAQYFPGEIFKTLYQEPFRACNVLEKYHATIKVKGSGKSAQLGAVIHGLARALVKANPDKFRPILKKKGFLTRDPRKRQRRQVGTGGKARRQKQSPKR
jgi:small subunit ribosomal protein S9